MGNTNKLGWIAGLALALGLNIGGGLWTTPVIASSIGGPITAVIALMCTLVVLLAAPTYLTLTRVLPITAGSYFYPTRLLARENKTVPHLIVWTIIWSQIAMGGFAILRVVLAAGAAYLHALFPTLPTQQFTLLLLGITFAVGWFGIEFVGKAEIIMSTLLVISLAVILGGGILNIDFSNFTPVAPNGKIATLSTYALIFSTVVGGFSIIEYGEEIKGAERTIGRIILASTGITLTISSAIIIVSVGIVPYTDLQNKTLQYVTSQYLPESLMIFVSIGALIAGLSTAIGLVPGVTRWMMAAAEDGLMPKSVLATNKHGESKYVIYFLIALSMTSVILNIPISAVVSAAALTGLGQILPVCLIGVVLPSTYPELLEHESIQECWYLSPRIVRWSSFGAVTLLVIMLVSRGMSSPRGVLWYLIFIVSGIVIYLIGKFYHDSDEFRDYSSKIDNDIQELVE